MSNRVARARSTASRSTEARSTRNELDASKTVQVRCVRCDGDRWIPAVVPEPYTCQRCRAVLARKNAADPLGTVGQRAALAKARQRLLQRRGEGLKGLNPEGGASRTLLPVLGGVPRGHARGAEGGGANG